jgi:hypothetical protein
MLGWFVAGLVAIILGWFVAGSVLGFVAVFVVILFVVMFRFPVTATTTRYII